VITDVGAPVVVTAKDPTCPTVKSAVALLVITGGAGATMEMVSASVAVLPELLVAVMVTGYVAPVAAVVGPEMVAVPLPLSLKVVPGGRGVAVPRAMVGSGKPVVVTV
jgi:hypothetical protein